MRVALLASLSARSFRFPRPCEGRGLVRFHLSFVVVVRILLPNTCLSMIPACPSLMCSFNRGNTEGTNSSKMCV